MLCSFCVLMEIVIEVIETNVIGAGICLGKTCRVSMTPNWGHNGPPIDVSASVAALGTARVPLCHATMATKVGR